MENPKLPVEISTVRYEPETRSEKEVVINNIKNLWIAKKRKITEIENKLILARKNWNSFFPIEEDLIYQKVIGKLNYIISERDRYQKEMEALTNS